MVTRVVTKGVGKVCGLVLLVKVGVFTNTALGTRQYWPEGPMLD